MSGIVGTTPYNNPISDSPCRLPILTNGSGILSNDKLQPCVGSGILSNDKLQPCVGSGILSDDKLQPCV